MSTNLKVLLAKANELISSINVVEAKKELHNENYVFIDVREKLELTSDGEIPGAIHIPRGMLEFYLDSNSPYYKEIFSLNKKFIFVCKSGGRSVLAAKTATDMGLKNAINLSGGILEWKK
mgnify:CR=1 FL=1